MALTEKVTFLLGVNSKGVVKEFDKVGRAADKSLGKAEAKIDKLGATFTKVGAGMLGAAGLAAAGLASTIGPASDLAEAVNVVGLTFGDSAEDIEKFGDTAASAMGMSKRAALEGAAAIGGLLKNVGFTEEESADLSKTLVTLSSDMGSAFNMEPVEALAALRSGLAGESEPLKRFNVFLNEAAVKAKAMELGLSDGTTALSEHEKAQARLAIIMEQTAAVQGDFAATADGAANSQRVLAAQMEDMKASIGQAGLPVFEDLVGAVNDLFGAFNSLSDPMKNTIGKMALFGTAIAGAGGFALLAAGKFIQMRSAVVGMPAAAKKSAGAIAGVTTAILLAIEAQKAWDDRQKRDAAEGAAVVKGLRSQGTEFERNAAAIEGFLGLNSRLGNELEAQGVTVQDVAKAYGDASGDFGKFQSAIDDGIDVYAGQGKLLLDMNALFDLLGSKVDEAAVSIEGAGVAAKGTEAAWSGLTGGIRSMAAAAGEVEDVAPPLTVALQNQALSFDDVQAAADGAVSALRSYFGIVRSDAELALDFEESIDSLAASFKENGATVDVSTEAGQKNRREGLRSLSVLEDIVAKKFEETASIDAATAAGDKYVSQLVGEMAEAMGGSTEDAAVLAEKLGLIPGDYTAQLTVEDEEAQRKANEMLELLNRFGNSEWIARLKLQLESKGIPYTGPPPANPNPSPDDFELDFSGGITDGTSASGTFGAGVSTAGLTAARAADAVNVVLQVDGRELARAVADGSQRAGGGPLLV